MRRHAGHGLVAYPCEQLASPTFAPGHVAHGSLKEARDMSIGPQLHGESLLARRTRFHQCWYRDEVLGLPGYGTTSGLHPRPLGSVLTEVDADRGANFTSPAAHELYQRRRRQGWGVDPTRCTRFLTSSQALTLNIFGPLSTDPQWLLKTLASLLGRDDLVEVVSLEIEFAPARTSDHMGDHTRVDALITVRSLEGKEVIVVEIKYADRFNSRVVDLARTGAYERLARISGLWNPDDKSFHARPVNQLLRCHALGASVLGAEQAAKRPPTLLVIHHAQDLQASRVCSSYRSLLAVPRSLQTRTLNELFAGMWRSTGPVRRDAVSALRQRYEDELASEPLWQEHERQAENRRVTQRARRRHEQSPTTDVSGLREVAPYDECHVD